VARRVKARRYAQAVFAIALEGKGLDRWQSDLKKMAVIAGDELLVTSLQNPKINFDIKARLLSEQLAGVNPLALNLILLLVTRGRLDMLGDIAEEYQRLLDSYRDIESAEVTTAVPLEGESKLKLEDSLGAIMNKRVMLSSKVDAGIIGGVIVRIGGKLLDTSTRSKLEVLRNELRRAERREGARRDDNYPRES